MRDFLKLILLTSPATSGVMRARFGGLGRANMGTKCALLEVHACLDDRESITALYFHLPTLQGRARGRSHDLDTPVCK